MDVQPVPKQNQPKSAPLCFIAEHGIMMWNISLVSLARLPTNVLYELLAHPESSQWGGRGRNRGGLHAVQTLFSKT